MAKRFSGCLTDVPGIKVGHAHSKEGQTGCTVIILEEGAISGVDIGGSAPGMRETEMLNPTNMILKIHAIMLSGGSTFGLQAAGGVQRFCRNGKLVLKLQPGLLCLLFHLLSFLIWILESRKSIRIMLWVTMPVYRQNQMTHSREE